MRGEPQGTAPHNCHQLQHRPGIKKEDKDPLTHLNDGQKVHSLDEHGHFGAIAKAVVPNSCKTKCVKWCWWSLLSPPQHLTLMGLLVWIQVKWSVPWEVNNHNISSLMPQEEDKKLLQQGRKDFVPGDDSFFQVPCCSPKERRKAALPGGCLAALHWCQGACKSSAQGIYSSTRQSHLSIHHQNTREKCPEHTPGRQTSSPNPPDLPSKILQLRDFPQILDVTKLEIKDWGSLKDNQIKSWMIVLG